MSTDAPRTEAETSVEVAVDPVTADVRRLATPPGTASRTPRQINRLGIALYYRDPAAADSWWRSVFRLGDWDVDQLPGHQLRLHQLPGRGSRGPTLDLRASPPPDMRDAAAS